MLLEQIRSFIVYLPVISTHTISSLFMVSCYKWSTSVEDQLLSN